ncbi:MAG: hypothetical protein COA45_12410 [Zetaproteobacteria bacterium]|nr:MAG: hypothetical protein COA45_12410 [Zetaproteobacteria bacterium]
MNIWVLLIFSFNMSHMTLETKEFYTQDACNKAKAVVESVIYSETTKGSPVEKTTKVSCIMDKK